ncbi:hypothetical protein F5887DRAFT_1013180 [Amanita rubescens]|nr:hypothetical protein F5887DRAFT_1013180 [Amanita rubescens]
MSLKHYRPRLLLLFPSYLPSCRLRPSRSFPGMSGQYGQSCHTDSIPVNLRQTRWHLQAQGSLWKCVLLDYTCNTFSVLLLWCSLSRHGLPGRNYNK